MSDIFSGLNEYQKSAVTHQGSPLLILAGAGSGKTRVLTHRAAYFVQSKLANPSEILLLTFTNKAAGEMKDRMSKLLPTKKSKTGSSENSTELWAGTFHSFGCRTLRIYGQHLGISSDFVIYDSDDQENLVRSILSEMGLTTKEFKPSSVLYFIEAAKNSYLTPDAVKSEARGFWEASAARIYAKYQTKLMQYQALDFNDLLFKTVELFQQFPEVLEKFWQRYRYILVDEYQDTNQIQYILTKLLAQKYRQITAVGDASQSIYGWRGADYKNLSAFTVDFSDATVINLEQNYRSTKNILEAANAVISKNTSHPVLKLFTTKSSPTKIKIFESDSEISEADYISQKIKELHDTLHFEYKDIAVLYRMNAQSRAIEESFLRNSISYVLIGGLRFYDRAEIKDIIAMLRVASNSADVLSGARVEKALGKRRKIIFDQHVENLNIKKMSSIQILESLVINSGYLDKYNPQEEDDLKKIENIKELKSVAATYPKLNDFLENIALVQQEYSLQEKNKKKENRNGVRLMTLHSSKGLEFEVVFLVGFEEGILPHSRSMVEDSDIEEERRLCYVGITRAKELLYITYASRRLFFGKSSLNEASRFLFDIPKDLLEYESISEVTHDYRHQHRFTKQDSNSDLVYDPDIY
ncbi:MAG TPA: UvrD-helicase domain-containing protein [Candidatus Methanoperedens sp.]|nr:UvrD-helicase domain-containing protein [Candidatus Methanoperedens sp.]